MPQAMKPEICAFPWKPSRASLLAARSLFWRLSSHTSDRVSMAANGSRCPHSDETNLSVVIRIQSHLDARFFLNVTCFKSAVVWRLTRRAYEECMVDIGCD